MHSIDDLLFATAKLSIPLFLIQVHHCCRSYGWRIDQFDSKSFPAVNIGYESFFYFDAILCNIRVTLKLWLEVSC